MNWKSTLLNEFACLRVEQHHQPDLPQAGRLVHHLANWSAITQDQWVLNMIRGYQIDFMATPYQRSPPTPPHYTAEQVTLNTGGNNQTPPEAGNKTGGKPFREGLLLQNISYPQEQRPVINLKALNSFFHPEHFKMEGIHTLKDLLTQGDWVAKVDLKDAYLAVPIHQSHQRFLQFQFQKKTFRFTCLPFGLSSALWVFTKVLKPALAMLCQRGVRLISYIDDILLISTGC